MASEAAADASEFAAFMDRLRDIDPALLLPFFLGLAGAADRPRPDPENLSPQNPETPTTLNPRQRLVFINRSAQRIMVIEGDLGFDSLFEELAAAAAKDGQPPASKASIDAMPRVEIVEGYDNGSSSSECVICLEQFGVGGEAKEMPCRHRFHGGCIEKWLKLHGSCPVCRYTMPAEEEEEGTEGARRVDGEIRVRVFVREGRRASQDSDHDDMMES